MARQDLDLKRKAIRYCLATSAVPFFEINVHNVSDVTDAINVLTDLDVVGLSFLTSGEIRRTLFDCKTVKVSPINRAFWAAGVSQYSGCDEAFVILQQPAVEPHRLSARAINVNLFHEKLFEAYAEADDIGYKTADWYMTDIDLWLRWLDNVRKNNHLTNLAGYLNDVIPLSKNYVRTFRQLLANVRSCAGEIDPAKNDHMAFFCMILSGAVIPLSAIVADFRHIFDPEQQKEDFESLLRYYIWGGRDNYEVRQRLKAYMAQKRNGMDVEFELYEWPNFLELVRMILDAPLLLSTCCLPCKELGFRFLADPDVHKDQNLAARLRANPRVRQFLFRLSEYIIKATRLPRAAGERFEQDVNRVMAIGTG